MNGKQISVRVILVLGLLSFSAANAQVPSSEPELKKEIPVKKPESKPAPEPKQEIPKKKSTTEPGVTVKEPVNNIPSKKGKVKIKINGELHSGYEALDREVDGSPDSTGPTQENAGFKVSRAYVNFKGKLLEGVH